MKHVRGAACHCRCLPQGEAGHPLPGAQTPLRVRQSRAPGRRPGTEVPRRNTRERYACARLFPAVWWPRSQEQCAKCPGCVDVPGGREGVGCINE